MVDIPTHRTECMISAVCKICGSPGDTLYESLHDRLFDAPGSWNLIRCRNPECGFLWISPIPDPATLAKAYACYYTHTSPTGNSLGRRLYERLRREYVALRFGYQRTRIRPWEKLASRLIALIPHRKAAWDASIMWLPAKSQGRLLEIGCGNGERLSFFKELGWNTYGIEPDSDAAAIACSKGHPITAASLEASLFPKESFDAIVMSHVIEHIESPRDVIRECAGLLRPGGRLVILTPNTRGLGHKWYREDWLHLDPPRHLGLFNRSALLRLTQGLRFTEIRCDSVIRDANWTLAASHCLRYKGTYRFGQAPLLFRLYGLVLLYVEWFRHAVNSDCGDELLLVARK